MSVSREKYEKIKQTNFMLQELCDEFTKENASLKKEISNYKKVCDKLPDQDELQSELENLHIRLQDSKKREKSSLEKLQKDLNREFHDREEKYKDKIAALERDKLLCEGKIQQLEEQCKDLRERYNELKQDYREYIKK